MLSQKERSPWYAYWFSIFNMFLSRSQSGWSFRSNNIDLLKRHINKDLVTADTGKMELARKCTLPIEESKEEGVYISCLQYNVGNCWWNGRLCKGEELSDEDKEHIKNSKRALEIVKPIPFTVDLIHGFESHLEYPVASWRFGSDYTFNFFLSKTLSWKVATFFAQASGSYFYQKYMLCRYTEPNSKHICMDIREFPNDEYEFLSGFETFRYVEKVYHLSFFPWPVLRVYHVFNYVS